MKLLQLRYLIQLAETGSFTKAATKLNVAQPVLSRQIKQLEQELGVALFRRNGRGVEPTAAGQELVRRSVTVFQYLSETREAVTAFLDKADGEVTIGILPLFGAAVVPELLLRCRDEHPGLRIKVMVGMSPAVHEWLISGRIDFGVISSSLETSKFIKTSRIASDFLHLVYRAEGSTDNNKPITLAKALETELVIPSRNNGIGTVIAAIAQRENIAVKPKIEVDSIEIIKGLILSGVGSTLLPRFAIEREIRAGLLHSRKVTSPPLEYHLDLATAVEKPLNRNAGIVAEILRSVSEKVIRP